ncbi:MAG: RIP metalloprotease RseP [Bacteroidales bacterium]|nr:RIP metalloprotease RseP [Bacteroidales bacterium]MBN2757116.1 RIP metalloprotease RseP [Bacteroidales bacterium]
MEILIKIAQLLLSLSILVVFHELGHFTFAKIFKTRVEKFYLFFNPWFSLFKTKWGETEYGIGWLPLGGYVKISGMIDESMDKEQLEKPAEPWEFRSKPSWQRLLIMIGGVLVNIILAFAIYAMMLSVWGREYLPTENVKFGITVDSLGIELGLRNGDKIISVGNKPVKEFSRIIPELILNDPKTIQIERDGQIVEINITKEQEKKIIKYQKPFFEFRFKFIVGGFPKNSTAQKAGLMINDKIVGINDSTVQFFDEFKSLLSNYKNQEITLNVIRNGNKQNIIVPVSNEGLIGFGPIIDTENNLELKKEKYSFFSAIPAGINMGYNAVGDQLKQLKLIPAHYDSLGGFIAIGNIFPAEWDWQRFWALTAMLSIMLGVLNLLPIPALDGGHVLFLLYEIISGRKPSDKFLEYAQIVGMVLLFSLLIYANGNDIIKLFQ